MKYQMMMRKRGKKRWLRCLVNPYENRKAARKNLAEQIRAWGHAADYKIKAVKP